MVAIKDELRNSTAPFTDPAAKTKAKTKGKSKVEDEIERKNQGTKPKRGTRADNAEHDHPSRHGDRGGDQDDDDEDERKPKRYLRKKALAKRYGDVNERTIPRMVADGRLPPPDMYNGRFPLWSEAKLDRWDRKAAREVRARREAAP
jgi:hypothetical protein